MNYYKNVYPPDPLTIRFMQQKRRQTKHLDAAKKRAVKVNQCVSILYYPTSRKFIYGHIEIEFKKTVYNLTESEAKTALFDPLAPSSLTEVFDPEKAKVPLKKMIRHAQSGGKPFYRFVIQESPKVISKLEQNIWKNRSFSCSYGAMSALANAGGFRVPPFFRIMPSLSCIYLTAAHAFSKRTVKKIEGYGSPKCLSVGVLFEVFYLLGSAALIYAAYLYALQINYASSK